MKHLNPPSKCDLCGVQIAEEFSDAHIVVESNRRWRSTWADLCPDCAVKHGAKYGTGLGQRYKLVAGEYQKVEG